MPEHSPIPPETLATTLAALAAGDGETNIPAPLMRELRPLANAYARHPRPFIPMVLSAILDAPYSPRALLHFERLLDSLPDTDDTPDVAPNLCCIIARIFISSDALSRRLGGNPSLLALIAALDAPLRPRTDRAYYRAQYRELARNAATISERTRALHRMQSVQLMRICARNASSDADITEIGAELSALAEAVIDICLGLAAEDIGTRSGVPRISPTLSVLGLGKLGGRELNVSSDIDLIYLYTEQADSDPDEQVVYHTILAERLTRFLTEATELGTLYRVDTRLRADGASGPLVRAMKDYFRYLEMRGEAWERQMLIKARPVGGDYPAAEVFLGSIGQFIFPASIARSPHREIVALKTQIEARLVAEGSKKTHLKLMPGGIRDIEFIAQCLQLLMGGIHPEVRVNGTRAALDALRNTGALSEEEHRILSTGYMFYRRIENTLQWRELLPAFALPADDAELDAVACILGTGTTHPGQKLRHEIDRISRDVRAIFEDIFSLREESEFAKDALAASLGGDGRTARFLESIGFPDPAESTRHLVLLASGDTPSAEATVHPSLEQFIPHLLEHLSALPDPSGALERFARIVNAYNARHTLFDILLANTRFFDLVLAIAHGSPFLTNILVRDPSLLDWLVEIGEIRKEPDGKEIRRELSRLDHDCDTNEAFSRACLTLKNREKLRAGARALTGITSGLSVFSELTLVAECIVRASYTRAAERLGAFARKGNGSGTFSVIAAGRLGAGMMDFGSDLDLIFVFREAVPPGIETTERAVRLAQNLLGILTGGGGANKVYDVDARLRPEGGGSVLAVSFEEYRKYLDSRASEWERLAMTRARMIAGDETFGREIETMLGAFAYRRKFTPEEIRRIMDIRMRMTEQSRKRHPGLVNVKSGAGGLADLDFTAQAYAAHFGAIMPHLRSRRTDELFAAFGAEGCIERADASALIEAHRFLCDTERALRIGSGRSINTIPESGAELMRVARLLGFGNVRKFRKRLDDVLTLSRERYERLMTALRSDAEHAAS